MPNTYIYTIVLCYPTGDEVKTVSQAVWENYTIPDAPEDYNAGSVTTKYRLYSADDPSIPSTIEYEGSNLNIYYRYSKWAVAATTGTRVSPGQSVNFEDFHYLMKNAVEKWVYLYPVRWGRNLRGKFSYGPYTYENITITGKCNYTGGTDVSIKSQVRKQTKAKYWTTIEGKPFNTHMTPGGTLDVDIDSLVDYNEGDTVHIKGVKDYTTDWTAYSSSKSVRDLPEPTAPSDRSETFNIYLNSDPEYGVTNTTLPVDGTKSWTFAYWEDENGSAVDWDTKPVTDVTYYAQWAGGLTTNSSFPQWSTSNYKKYRETGNSYELNCYTSFFTEGSTPELYFTTSVPEVEYKPVKHTGWTDGTSTYAVGSNIPYEIEATYTAVWVIDESGSSWYESDEIPHPYPPSRVGYTYLGLMPAISDGNIHIHPGDTLKIMSDETLYAVWDATGSFVKIFNETTGKFEEYIPLIYNESTSTWDQCRPMIFNGTDWNDLYI